MPNPYDILKGLSANNGANLYNLQSRFRDEARLKNRMGGQVPGGPDFAGLASDYEEDMQTGPVGQQMQQAQMFDQENQAAMQAGFGSYGQGATPETSKGQTPFQSREIYRREFEREKMRQPIQQTEMEQSGAMARAKEQSRGIIEQARVGADARTANAEALLGMLNGGGLAPGQRISLPGGGSINAPAYDAAPNAALQAIQTAGLEYDNAVKNQGGLSKWWNSGPDENIKMRRQALDQAVSGFLAQDPSDVEIKNFAFQVYSDPEADNTPNAQVIQMAGQAGWSPEDLQQLQQILNVIRRGK